MNFIKVKALLSKFSTYVQMFLTNWLSSGTVYAKFKGGMLLQGKKL